MRLLARFKYRGEEKREKLFEYDGKIERSKYLCSDCGKKHLRTVGFLLKDGDASSAYRAYLHGNDSDKTIQAMFEIIFADWQNSKDYEVFTVVAREKEENVVFTLIDPCENIDSQGWHYLTREESLKHLRVRDVWDVIDFLGIYDPSVRKILLGK